MRARNLAFFERELQLAGVEPLRMPAELGSLELPNDLAHSLDTAEQFVALGDQRHRRGAQAQHVFGKRVGRRHRSPDSTIFRPAWRLSSAAPIHFVAVSESPAAV